MRPPDVPVEHRDRNDAESPGVVREDGFDFGFDPAACAACAGRCCRGESGRIWVDGPEVVAIRRFLGTNPVDFIRTYLHRVDNRLSIRELPDEDGFRCIFLENGAGARCGIYPVRPRQCRAFPFWDRFRTHGHPPVDECPGIRCLEPQNQTPAKELP